LTRRALEGMIRSPYLTTEKKLQLIDGTDLPWSEKEQLKRRVLGSGLFMAVR
jgi:hypothetical protein